MEKEKDTYDGHNTHLFDEFLAQRGTTLDELLPEHVRDKTEEYKVKCMKQLPRRTKGEKQMRSKGESYVA